MGERENDKAYLDFIHANYEAIFEMFDFLENETNYFAKREGLKTQYLLLARFDDLRTKYTANKDRLKQIM